MDSEYVRMVNRRDDPYGLFDSYSIVRLIGEGGSGKVYLVTKKGKSYAMKVPVNIRIDMDETVGPLKDEGFLESYKKEAENWITVSEKVPDDVIRFLDYNIVPFPWMIMELAETDLKTAMKDGAVTIDDIIGMLHSLQRIHDAGILHLDIKPENIMKVRGRWKFSDFGVSRAVSTVSVSSGIKGTPEYLAPEQISRKFGPKSIRTDIWQMGVVVYRFLEGCSPYQSTDLSELSMEIITDGPDLSKLPEQYRDVMSKAFDRDQDARYQSAGSFADAIMGWSLPTMDTASESPLSDDGLFEIDTCFQFPSDDG